MPVLSVRLPAELHAVLAGEARRSNIPRSTLARRLIARGLQSAAEQSSPNCLDLVDDLVGVCHSGRRDLSTNRRLLEDAVIEDARRGGSDGHR